MVAPRQLEAPTAPELRGRRTQTTVYTHKTKRKNVRRARGQAELKAATALYALIMTQLKRRARKLGFVFHNRRALELQGALHREPEWGRRTIHSPRKVFPERSDRSPPSRTPSCARWLVPRSECFGDSCSHRVQQSEAVRVFSTRGRSPERDAAALGLPRGAGPR